MSRRNNHHYAPWTPEQVEALNFWQTRSDVHPFTCQNSHPEDRTLVATPDGWICKHCSYTQLWAHHFMLMPRNHPDNLPRKIREKSDG